MQPPTLPEDETDRLCALWSLDILDTAPEERFDRITRLAKRLFSVPIALISLVDEDRQWFKSKQGINQSQTNRQISFCGHAIVSKDTFVVEDTHKDPRFADNPLVTKSPHIRFYAGCAIRSPQGFRIGTLCIVDRKPRILTPEDKQLLGDLTAFVERELFSLQLATMDSLTGLSNRRAFDAIATHMLSSCQRLKKKAVLISVDLDNLKQINDNLGHEQGDNAIKEMASILKDTFRGSDLIARFGGDEFAVLLFDTSDYRRALFRLQDSQQKHNAEAQRRYYIQFSAGATIYHPTRKETLTDLLKVSDARMYETKRLRKSSLPCTVIANSIP